MKVKLESNKEHQKYFDKDGNQVYGVTTILSMLDKPALMFWAWNQGKAGLDLRKTKEKAADIGTLAHFLAECHLKGNEPDLDEFSKDNISKAENAFLAFLDWEKKSGLKLIDSELQLSCPTMPYGGTIDIYAEIGGKKCLCDLKTSKGIYPEMKIQMTAYAHLLEWHDRPVEEIHLIRIDKENGNFEWHKYQPETLTNEWELFKLLCKAYPLYKKINKKGD
jgi:hypothetical protein